jgi:hypothetical protein
MKITRKQFLSVSAGAAALAAVPASNLLATSCAQPGSTGKPKRGVSIYCYQGLMHWCMNLEDVFKEMYDMNATGFEILANGYIENYPNPTDEWMESWHAMLKKYNIVPVEYGHWVDSKLLRGQFELSTKESFEMISRDIKLAHKLGFTIGRTKLGVMDGDLTPVKNWREFIEMSLPVAEENNFKMCPEIHSPTRLKSKMIDDYVEFIEKTKTKWFGLNIDFGVFATRSIPREMPAGSSPVGAQVQQGQQGASPAGARPQQGQQGAEPAGMSGIMRSSGPMGEPSQPEDIIPLLPYVYCCHAKFNDMSEDMVETTIPYDKVIKIMIDHKWDGYLLSEYEGPSKDVPGYAAEQTRRHHVMLKKLLGEV